MQQAVAITIDAKDQRTIIVLMTLLYDPIGLKC
jgi:hypothetical protein